MRSSNGSVRVVRADRGCRKLCCTAGTRTDRNPKPRPGAATIAMMVAGPGTRRPNVLSPSRVAAVVAAVADGPGSL